MLDNFLLSSSCFKQQQQYSNSKSEKAKSDDESDVEPRNESDDATTVLYVCATIWHENQNEMLQLLKSLIRLDKENLETREKIVATLDDEGEERKCSSMNNFHRRRRRNGNGNHLDFYEYEAHIFVDDAIEIDSLTKTTRMNRFVCNFIDLIDTAATYIYNWEFFFFI